MRLVTNNIGNRLKELDEVLDYSKDITKKSVEALYFEKFKRDPKDCWGCNRVRKFHNKNIYYQAVNTLKLFRKNKIKTNAGYVYFLIHPKFPEYLKVGSTLDVDYRLKQFNTGCPFREYKVLLYFISENRVEDERLVQERMSDLYQDAEGEWFKTGEISKAIIEKIIAELPIKRIGSY